MTSQQDRSEYDSEMEITYEYDPVTSIFLKNYNKKGTDQSTDKSARDVVPLINSEEDLVKINKAIWDADDQDYWQTGILLEKGAALGDFMCKFKLATWLESIDATRSIEIFEELLTTPE